jgi:hypothetical protein
LARPEGFEPPTPRSVVRFEALLAGTAKKTRAHYLGFPEFSSIRFYPVSCAYGTSMETTNMIGGTAFSLRPVDGFDDEIQRKPTK